MGIPSDADAEAWASRIRQVITDARRAGVDVSLDWKETYDGISVKLSTIDYEEVDGLMQVKSAWIVEGY